MSQTKTTRVKNPSSKLLQLFDSLRNGKPIGKIKLSAIVYIVL